MIRTIVIAGSILIASTSVADAASSTRTVQRSVPSSKKVLIKRYMNFDRHCRSASGVVKFVTKPRNGTLTTGISDARIPARIRYRPDVVSPCAGKPVKTFDVYYTSMPGFRGRDNFTIEATHSPELKAVDYYSLSVR